MELHLVLRADNRGFGGSEDLPLFGVDRRAQNLVHTSASDGVDLAVAFVGHGRTPNKVSVQLFQLLVAESESVPSSDYDGKHQQNHESNGDNGGNDQRRVHATRWELRSRFVNVHKNQVASRRDMDSGIEVSTSSRAARIGRGERENDVDQLTRNNLLIAAVNLHGDGGGFSIAASRHETAVDIGNTSKASLILWHCEEDFRREGSALDDQRVVQLGRTRSTNNSSGAVSAGRKLRSCDRP